ncbi:mediator of RNA polymerase II transcription subunit 24 isoform X1 [Oncorhynchus mykiss]|uniref:mediator of RNA polymerase II transcription subunit 24 isoform X1 n=1 Tax=Oncorhynchus mykiss TaxID=8022 RepID=UPI0018783A89|nr:mediator of RNA polymerase II transcription subunit 24 isoform X1 [Oncorhynchus mykiss]
MVVWLLTGCAWYCERLGELGPAAVTEASHRACQERLRDLVNSTKNRALVHIACLENQASWTNVELAFFKVTEGLSSLTNQTERQAGNVYFIGEEYSYDRVGTVRPPASLIVPLGPRLHHAGRNHEPDGGDSATGGTADDDQEGADGGRRPLPSLQRACWLCRDTCCLEKAWTPSWLHIAATGKLTSFARMFIKLNEFLKHFSGEGFGLGASPAVRHILPHAVSRVADLRIRSDPVGPQPLRGEQDPEPRPPLL